MSEINEISAALIKAQKAISHPSKNKEVAVKTKAGHTYKFKYATLDSIIDGLREPLTDNGLWFTQTLEQDDSGKPGLRTSIIHTSGQTISSYAPIIVQDGGNQGFGSALTYMRRYCLTAIFGLASDEDDDGNLAEGNAATTKKPATKPKPMDRKKSWEIPVTDGDFDAFMKRFLDGLKKMDNLEDINKACTDNTVSITTLASLSKDKAEYLNNQVEARRHFLANKPE